MFLAVLFTALALVVARVLWWRWRYDLHKIPSPPAWPCIGHLLPLMSGSGEGEFSRFLGASWRGLGQPKILKLSVLGMPIVVIRDVECAKNVVMSKTDPFPKASRIVRIIPRFLGGDASTKILLATTKNTPYVKAMRKVYSNAFQTSNLKASLPKLRAVLDRMIDIIETQREKGPIDFQELCVKMTLDAIGVVALDMPLGGLDGDQEIYQLLLEVGHIAARMRQNPFKAILLMVCPFLKEAQKQRGIVDELTSEWKRLTAEVVAKADPPEGEEPIWHGLRTLVDPETGRSLEHTSLVAEVAAVVLSGMDTTGHQLSCILALLADHPQVVEKLIEELKQHGVYGTDREITLDDLADLSYLSAIVKEGMRVAHVLHGTIEREVPNDMTILGYRIPKGTIVNIPGTRRLSSVEDWGDPDAYRPERWLTDEDLSEKYYLGFSFGPRDCVGQKLATLEIRLAIVGLVQRYTLTSRKPFEEVMKRVGTGSSSKQLTAFGSMSAQESRLSSSARGFLAFTTF